MEMQEEILNINIPAVKQDLHRGINECQQRGLVQSAKWLAELNQGLVDVNFQPAPADRKELGIADSEYDNYYLAKSYFDCREYDRAAFFTRNCESPVPKFLYFYSTYMAKEKRRLDNMIDCFNFHEKEHVKDLSELLEILKVEHNHRKLDGYSLYLYGVILKKLDLTSMAISVFIEAVHKTPTMWGAWLELSPLVADKEKLMNLNLPNHWMKQIFIGHTLIELFLNDEALKQYDELEWAGFAKCFYVSSQKAIIYHNKRDVDKAIELFKQLQEIDPFRLDNLDTYSNLLFVRELKTEIAFLAHKAAEINKFRPETCCVIGNYYSIRQEHQKAVVYFQRALKLNPQYLSAWTLMGHEFMEMKNKNAAIQSYRKAIEVNRRDFRAWYGLGQAYEILGMHFYSLYYYKMAQTLRPYDSRMLVALGETYEKLEKHANAVKCYQKACNVGDIEGVALLKLTKLYEKLGDGEKAISGYLNFCADERVIDKTALSRAYLKLATYYESISNYEEASHFAYKCLEHEETKNEAKSLLQTIANKRTVSATAPADDADLNEVVMDESDMVIETSGNESALITIPSTPTEQLATNFARPLRDDDSMSISLLED